MKMLTVTVTLITASDELRGALAPMTGSWAKLPGATDSTVEVIDGPTPPSLGQWSRECAGTSRPSLS